MSKQSLVRTALASASVYFCTTMASAQLAQFPPAACQNFDNQLRYFSTAQSEQAFDIAMTNVPLSLEGVLPGAVPYLVGFGLSQPETIQLSLTARDDGDPMVSIFDSNGDVVAYNDDGPEGLDSLLQAPLQAGNYCAVLSRYGEVEPMEFYAELRRVDAAMLTQTPTQSTAPSGPVCSESTQTADLGVLTEATSPLTAQVVVATAPYLNFTWDGNGVVELRANNEDADPVVILYTADNVLYDENDDYHGLNARLLLEDLPAGEYCVEIDALSDSSAPIEVSITQMSAEDIALEAVRLGEQPPIGLDNYTVIDLGVVQNTVSQPAFVGEGAWWGTFTLDEASLVEIDAPEIAFDPVLSLFDANGEWITEDDDSGMDLGARLYARLDAGTYWVTVFDFDNRAQTGLAAAPLTITRYVRAE